MLTVPLDKITKRLYQWALGDRASPLVVQLFLMEQPTGDVGSPETESITQRTKDVILQFETDLLNAFEEMTKMGVDHFRIVGGLNNSISLDLAKRIIAKVKESGAEVTFFSQGMKFSKSDMEELVGLGVDYFEFTVLGPDEESHYHGRERDHGWKNTESALDLISYLKGLNLGEGPSVCINYILTKYNWDRLSNAIRYANRAGANFFQVHPKSMLPDDGKDMKMKKSQAREILLVRDDLITLCGLYALEHNLNIILSEKELLNDPSSPNRDSREKERAAIISKIVTRFQKRYPKMEKPFIRFATLKSFEPWYMLSLGPEGIFVPREGGTVPVDVGGDPIEEIWFGSDFNKLRTDLLSRSREYAGMDFMFLHSGTIKGIQKGIFKRWRDAYRLQPGKAVSGKALLAEFRKREINVKVKMLDRDMQLLENELRTIKRRIEIYSKDKVKIDRLKRSKAFRLYRVFRRMA